MRQLTPHSLQKNMLKALSLERVDLQRIGQQFNADVTGLLLVICLLRSGLLELLAGSVRRDLQKTGLLIPQVLLIIRVLCSLSRKRSL